jgi:hypothetical protein
VPEKPLPKDQLLSREEILEGLLVPLHLKRRARHAVKSAGKEAKRVAKATAETVSSAGKEAARMAKAGMERAGEAQVETARIGKEAISELGKPLGAMLSLEEEDPAMPEALQLVQDGFWSALRESKHRFDEATQPGQADAFRHVIGSRRAALDAGIVPALLGGVGHELRNLQRATGSAEDLRNNAMDIYNNLLGVISAVRNPEPLTAEQEAALLDRASMFGFPQGEKK